MPVVHNAMMLIKPSSVNVTGVGSSATINDSGSVTFATAVTLSLNGVFSSLYDNYIIDMRHQGGSGTTYELQLRLRASGTDASGGNYTRQFVFAGSTTIVGERSTNNNVARIGSLSSTQRSGLELFMYGPNLAQPTAFRSVPVEGADNARILDCAATHSLSTAYDGFTLLASTDTFTGLMKVYGLRQ
jgi:hypothetical protein